MKSLLLTFMLAFTGVVSLAGVLSFVEKNILPQPVQAESKLSSRGASSGPVMRLRRPAIAAPRPKIRVGLYQSNDPITLQVATTSQVLAGDAETELGTVPSNERITLSYDRASGLYSISGESLTTTTSDYIKIKPKLSNTVTTITSYSNVPSWDETINDNKFYGAIELHYATATDAVWVINELGIENYVKGVSEAGNDNTSAYLKTLYTAARSYAYYHYLYPSKHADEHFTLDATANDQVYRGYGFTQRASNITAAVDATAGYIVHYNGEPVVTPYFSQSDGRTRAWSEVWSGDYPYLQSVTDPCCTNETLLGHGVGLSAKGARYFGEHNWHWREILQYYYQGIELKQLW